jgi:hypothetical protein
MAFHIHLDFVSQFLDYHHDNLKHKIHAFCVYNMEITTKMVKHGGL